MTTGIFLYVSMHYVGSDQQRLVHCRKVREYEDPVCTSQSFRMVPKITMIPYPQTWYKAKGPRLSKSFMTQDYLM